MERKFEDPLTQFSLALQSDFRLPSRNEASSPSDPGSLVALLCPPARLGSAESLGGKRWD